MAGPQTFHLTLKFLGNLDDAAMAAACRLPARALEVLGTERFEIRLAGLGAFPKPSRARVVWAAVEGDTDPLRQWAEWLEARAAEELDVRPEGKAYHPHVTLARKRGSDHRRDAIADVETLVERYARRDIGKLTVREVVTYRSHLRQGGPEYEPLSTVQLG